MSFNTALSTVMKISCLSNAEQAALYQRAEVCRLRWLRTTPCSFLTRYCLKKNCVRLQCLQIIEIIYEKNSHIIKKASTFHPPHRVTLFPYSTASKKYQYFKAIASRNRLFSKIHFFSFLLSALLLGSPKMCFSIYTIIRLFKMI